MEWFGAWSLIPVLIILIVAVTTRRTLLALLIGTIAGSLMIGGWNIVDTWVGYFSSSLANETTQWLLLIVVLFGILLAIFERSGAVSDFAAWAERFVRSRRSSTLLTFLLSVVLFIDDYLNVLAVGTGMKAVTDRYRVPRTELGTIIKMTAAPIAVVVPFSTWALFFSGLFEADGVTVDGSGFGAYLQSIPFIFFGWIALAIAFLLAMGWFPRFGLLKKDALRAERDGDVFPIGTTDEERAAEGHAVLDLVERDDADGSAAARVATAVRSDTAPAKNPQPWAFLVPMAVLVAVTIITDANVVNGTMAAIATSLVFALAGRRLQLRQIADTAIEGLNSMLFVFVLVVLAIMVQLINIDLQLADYVISAAEPAMSPALLPMVVFLICCVYAYATGSFWDLAIVVTPVVLPLAMAIDANPILAGAAVFSGAALGSTTCLYGDGIILASRAIGIKPMNLMLTILPYAGIAAGVSAVLYLVAGVLGW